MYNAESAISCFVTFLLTYLIVAISTRFIYLHTLPWDWERDELHVSNFVKCVAMIINTKTDQVTRPKEIRRSLSLDS